MPNIIETLKKIRYDNIDQLLSDLNANFGIIQNSPLFKGVPGKQGDPGNPGLRGTRGSKFIFVFFNKFVQIFTNDNLLNNSQINLAYINSKLSSFVEKQKLLNALEITELVDNDIIVLTNSIMLSYSISTNSFTDTGIAFNEQVNLISSIGTRIEDYIEQYVAQNQTIQSLHNIFEIYNAYAKNYSDTSNLPISDVLTGTSVFVPYIPGQTTTNGVELNSYKYFGINNTDFPTTNSATIIFGSVRRFTEMLTNTISSIANQTLSSEYAPGENNIPTAVFLQDTINNGIMFGLKSKNNLKEFGSIYKDELGNVVIKTDAGQTNASEFSKLIIGKLKIQYAKDLYIGGNAEFGGITNVGHWNGLFFRSGANITGNTNNNKKIQVGYKGIDELGEWENISNDISLTKFTSKVLITDALGKISKEYSLENIDINEDSQLGDIDNPLFVYWDNVFYTLSNKKLLTSNYLGYLLYKLNVIQATVEKYYTQKIELLDIYNELGYKSYNGYWSANDARVFSYGLEIYWNDDVQLYYLSAGKLIVDGIIYTLVNDFELSSDLYDGVTNISYNDGHTCVFTNNDKTLYIAQYEFSNIGRLCSFIDVKKKLNLSPDVLTTEYTTVPSSSTENLELIPVTTDTTPPTNAVHVEENLIVKGNQLGWLIKILNNIKTRLKNTYNKSETLNNIYNQTPFGAIILWDNAIVIPDGYVYCNGTTYNEIPRLGINYEHIIIEDYTVPNLPTLSTCVYIIKMSQFKEIDWATVLHQWEIGQPIGN